MIQNDEYLMKVDVLGRIYIKDVIVFYGEPLLFSCINDFKNCFLFNCLDMNESEKQWLVLPISEAKLIRGLKGNISLYKMFKEPEGEFLWKVSEYSQNELCKSYPIKPEELKKEDLPDEDIFYDIYNDEFLEEYDDNILGESIKERREVIDISLEPNESHAHEIDASVLGSVLNSVQNIVNVIAHKKGVNAKVPKEIKEDNKLIVTGNYAASFGIRLKSNSIADLLNQSKIQESLSILMDILESKCDIDKLTNIFNELNPSAIILYKSLLKLMNRENISFKTYCAFPNRYYKQISFASEEIKRSIKNLENDIKELKREVDLYGKVAAIDTLKNKFTFITIDDTKIKGDIGENINIEEYYLPKYANIKLEMVTKLNDVTGQENIKYKLLELEYDK